jgi:hypothetical protein
VPGEARGPGFAPPFRDAAAAPVGWNAVLTMAVALLFPLPGSAQYNGPFSHRKHLATGVPCAQCHEAAATSVKADDNLLPAIAVCGGCHGPGEIKEPARLTLSRFNHQLHVSTPKLGDIVAAAIRAGSYLGPVPEGLEEQLAGSDECTACHRGLRDSDQVTKAAFPNMAECLVCHRDVDPPFSCGKCHSSGDHLKPASHTPDFLEAHSRPGARPEKQSCQVCHGRKFTCLGCH